jgi:RNA polymerase sigma-70 factor (ECF subfamily)
MLRLIRGKAPGTEAVGERAAEERPVDEHALLVQKSRAGDPQALRTLLTAVGPAMVQVIRRVLGGGNPDLEDVFQEAAFGFVEALASFRGECTTLHFACRVAVLSAMASRRRQQIRGRYGVESSAEEVIAASPDGGPSVEALALAARRRALLRRLVEDLAEPQAEVLLLHCAAGFTLEEVARASGVPLETARSRLRLAKAALRARIEEEGLAVELSEVDT